MTDVGAGVKSFAERVKSNAHERVGNAKSFVSTLRTEGLGPALAHGAAGMGKANRDLFPNVFRVGKS